MSREQVGLEDWRSSMMSDLESSDIGVSTTALLALTYDDPDRRRVEVILLDRLASEGDHQMRALAVTCMGHIARIHKAASVDVIRRLEGLLEDPVLGGRAEDALDDIASFLGDRLNPG